MHYNIKYSEYSIDLIEKLTEKKLFIKIKRLGVKTIKDFLNLKNEDFQKQKGIGEKALGSFIEFQDYVKNNEDLVLDYIEKTSMIVTIPNTTVERNFLVNISKIVSIYCSHLKKPEYQKILEKYYGLDGNQKMSYNEIAPLYNYSNERIRQLVIKTKKEIQTFFINEIDETKKIRIEKSLIAGINLIKKEYENKACIVLKDFKHFVKNNLFIDQIDQFENELLFLIDLLDFSMYGKLETDFTTSTLISTEAKTRKYFPKIGSLVIGFLKKKCIQVSEDEILIYIKKRIGKFDNHQLMDFIKCLPEVELIKNDSGEVFQIKFHLLSKASDKAYRVLSENKKEMYIDDIVTEINKIQVKQNQKIYNRDSLTLPRDKRFKSFGKTGYWTLSNDEKSSDKIEDLLIRAIYRLDKPSSFDEILFEVKKERENVNEKSVKILLSKICLFTVNDKYILKEWKTKYGNIDLKKKGNKRSPKPKIYRVKQLEDVINYLENKKENKEFASKIIKDLSNKNEKYTSQSFYKLFENEANFKKIMINKSLLVQLKIDENFIERDVFKLIEEGENSNTEFKETLRYCLNEKKKKDYIEESVLKTIAAFMNSNGGDLIIGVSDNQQIKGLDRDYLTFREDDQNRDGFLKHLDNMIGKTFSNSVFSILKIVIHAYNGFDFCQISVKPKKDNTTFITFKGVEHFFIRRAGSSISLTNRETLEYLKNQKV